MSDSNNHFDSAGNARMVDVGDKESTHRVAVAEAVVHMQARTMRRIAARDLKKGDVLTVAQVAGVQAAKRTADLIPLCHPLPLTHVAITFELGEDTLRVQAQAECRARTGVEMEALTAAAVAALTIYDMCKGIDRGMSIDTVRLVEKRGGRSGTWRRSGG